MRYGCKKLNLGAFLGSVDSTASGLAPTDSLLGYTSRICLRSTPTSLHQHPTVGPPIFLRPSIAHFLQYGNINPFSISYGFRPRLRDRLTPGRLTLPGKPWVFGEQVFHLFYRYSCQHNHFSEVQHTLQYTFSPRRTLPYQTPIRRIRSFGTILSPVTFSAQSH